MASVALALELADMGLTVRRRSWPTGDYIRAHKPQEWGHGSPPDTLPGEESITRYEPTGDDLAADDWELA